MRHVLITMFNRRLGGRGPFAPGIELDDAWLRYRWGLFTTFTVPSIAAQTETDFTWFVICHPDSPAWLRALTGTVSTPSCLHFSYLAGDPALSPLAHPEANAILVTRIDSDDAWHRSAMERIREDCELDPYTSQIVTASDGYLLDNGARRMRPYHVLSPAFCTKVNFEPSLDPLDMGGAHHRVRRRYPSRSISEGEPMFVVVTHAEHHRGRDFNPRTDGNWLPVGTTAEILARDFGVTLPVAPGAGDVAPEPASVPGRASTGNGSTLRPSPPAAHRRPIRRAQGHEHRVVVSIPCFQAWDSLPRAVESILGQTHADLLAVVANDGDLDPQWQVLDHIDDPRLVRVDYPANRGRYFVDQATLMGRLGRYLLIQDADDWSEPNRVEALLAEIRTTHSVAAVSAHYQYRLGVAGPPVVVTPTLASSPATSLYLDGLRRPLRSTYFGLFEASHLLGVGGCYGGYRFAYDTFVLHLLRMTGPVSSISAPLYHRQVRPGSLTTSEATGLRSRARATVTDELASLYQEAYHVYCEYVAGRVSATVLAAQLRSLAWRKVTKAEWDALRDESDRLRWRVRSATGQLA